MLSDAFLKVTMPYSTISLTVFFGGEWRAKVLRGASAFSQYVGTPLEHSTFYTGKTAVKAEVK